MGMIENEERLKLREKTKDFLLNCGSEFITTSQVTTYLNTNTHTSKNILEEFEKAGFVKPTILAPNTNNPQTLWKSTTKLEKASKEDFEEIIKIEKPKKDK